MTEQEWIEKYAPRFMGHVLNIVGETEQAWRVRKMMKLVPNITDVLREAYRDARDEPLPVKGPEQLPPHRSPAAQSGGRPPSAPASRTAPSPTTGAAAREGQR